MDADDFFTLAQRLAVRPTEAERRTAVSRAYYAAFHLALQLIDSRFGVVVPINQAHVKLAFCLQSGTTNTTAVDAGQLLATLRDARKIADYQLNSLAPASDEWARLQVEIAHDAISAIKACASEQDLATIMNEVRDYARNRLHWPLREPKL
jgi:uncharacterized protein (UPF0332 family)